MSEQVRRIVHILKKLESGHRVSSKQILDDMPDDLTGATLRTIQRDLVLIQECIPELTFTRQGREQFYEYDRRVRKRPGITNINSNELLSLYILKAHLRTFDNTVIDEEVKGLVKKLETIAPSDVYLSESLYWDQNIGQYDYTQSDFIIRDVLRFTANKKWVDIEYYSSNKGKTSSYTVMFQKIFTYYGMLYVASYLPSHKKHIALSIQNIEKITEKRKFKEDVPEFNFKEWNKSRFGVFEGEPQNVELFIPKIAVRLFVNRHWHSSQQFTPDEKGNMILSMTVPLTPDFISWLLSWSDMIRVLSPKSLRKHLKDILIGAVSSYVDL